MGFLEIPLELIRAQSDAWAIPGEVVPQLVPLGHHLLDQRLLPCNPPGDQEEGRPGIISAELGQDRWRGPGIRPIVYGQGHQARPSRHLVKTPGEKIRHPVDEPSVHAQI